MKFCTAVTLLATAGSAAAFVTNQQSDVKTALSASYLEQLAGPKTPHRPVQNSGISSYLDTVQTGSALQGGAGIGSYLDSVNSACNTIVPTDQCAEAISDYMSAAANGAAQPEANYVAAQTIGNYLDNLAGAAPTRQGGPGIQSYLSTVPTASSLAGGSGLHTYQDTVASNSAVSSSAGAVKGFLDALSSNGAVAPSAPAVKSYLQDVSSGSVSAPSSTSGIASYLNTVATNSALAGGQGIVSFQSTVATNPERAPGAGLVSYLDAIERECNAMAPTENCADAINNYMEAVSSGDIAPSADGAKVIGSYLDALGNSASQRISGSGLVSYLDTIHSASSLSGGEGLKTFQDSVGSASAPAVMNHLNNLASSGAAAPSSSFAASSSGISSYLNTVATNSALAGGQGIVSFQSSVATNPERTSGAGLVSYLDAIQKECNAVAPTEHCAPAIANAMNAVSTGEVKPEATSAVAGAIGSYLDALGNAASQRSHGPGIQNHLSSLTSSSSLPGGSGLRTFQDSVGSASAVKSFLDDLSNGNAAAPSVAAVESYTSAVSSGDVAPPSSNNGIASYLSTIPTTSHRVGGQGIVSYLDTVASSSALVGGSGLSSFQDSVNIASPVPVQTIVADPVSQVLAANPHVSPTTTVDTQVSQDGLQTTITITSVTTVVIDDTP